MYSFVIVLLLLYVYGSMQQQQSFYFFMQQSLMEAPLIANNNTVYPHFEIYDDALQVFAYTIMPSQTSGTPASVVGILQTYMFCCNYSLYIFTYDLSKGTSNYVEILSLIGQNPLASDVIAANPSTHEIITVTSTQSRTANLTIFNPTTGTYRYAPLVGLGIEPFTVTDVVLDISAQIVYVTLDYYDVVTLQAYDAKSAAHLTTFNLTSDSPDLLWYVLFASQNGNLYGIEISSKNTSIVSIDIQNQTTHLLAQIPGNFSSKNWAYEPSTETFYAVFAGRVYTVTIDGIVSPLRLVPSDMGCAEGNWVMSVGTQQQKHTQQAEPEMIYLCNVAYSYNNVTNAVQALSHKINGSSIPFSAQVLTPPLLTSGYASIGQFSMSCYHATAEFFIEQSETYGGQFLNFISYSSQEVLQQFVIDGIYTEFDHKLAWNSLTNRTILSQSRFIPFNSTWQMAFFELDGSATNSTPLITLSFANIKPAVWAFDPSSQTVFGFQSSTGTLFGIQYPNGNIYWKLDLSAYAVWSSVINEGIAVNSKTQKLYIIICNNGACSDGGPASLVEISYSQTSASIDSITPIGTYLVENDIISLHTVPSQGGVIWATFERMFFFDTRTKQYTDITPFGLQCVGCMLVHDI